MFPGIAPRANSARPFFLVASCAAAIAFAGCSGAGGAGVGLPATQQSAPVSSSAALLPQSSSAASDSISASGTIDYVFDGGFNLNTGSTHGRIDVYTSSSTKVTGSKPFVGESVSVSGTGSWSTSIKASSVDESGASAPSSKATAAPTATPAAKATAAPTAAPVSGTVIWQAGSSTLGHWIDANTYQCGSPTQSGATFSFSLTQDGTSCGRNQAQPENANGTLSTLQAGQTYTWTFNYVDGKPSGGGPGMGPDSEAQALIWQMHDDGASGASASLGFANVSGAQVWDFSIGGTPEYLWTGKYTAGETDQWKIVVKVSNTSSGTEQLYRNGTLVMSATGPNYSSSANPWWNFGPYKWRWELSGGGGSDMKTVNCTIENMTVTQQ